MTHRYTVRFERIGRNHKLAPNPVTIDAAGEADLARQLRAIARPHLRSRDFDVMLDMVAGTGWFACGMHSGGECTVQRMAA